MLNHAFLADKIHNSGLKFVVAVTGGGTDVFGNLLRNGGGSASLLEAVIPYNQDSFRDFVGGKPEKFVSAEAARDLAMASFQRGLKLCGETPFGDVIGIGATSSLKKNLERSGRTHHAFVAMQTFQETRTWSLMFDESRTREEEEGKTADLILAAMIYASGQHIDWNHFYSGDAFLAEGMIYQNKKVSGLLTGHSKKYRHCLQDMEKMSGVLIMPGSFNPPHPGHLEMARVASQLHNGPVNFEISVRNVDKTMLNFQEIKKRIEYLEQISEPGIHDSVYVTDAPLFTDKAKLFPGSVFIVGYDTIERLNNANRYGQDLKEVCRLFRKYGISFRVFHRIINGQPSTDEMFHASIDKELADLCGLVPLELFTPTAHSSSAIRKGATR